VSIDDLEAGDTVFVGKRRTPRLIRSVSKDAHGRLRAVVFAIRRCSWTKRPYTVYQRCDFGGLRMRPSGWPRATFGLPSDQALLADINDHRRQRMHCCDVVGWP
jgi:hypothetical protein